VLVLVNYLYALKMLGNFFLDFLYLDQIESPAIIVA
jgi:hypothetical protein